MDSHKHLLSLLSLILLIPLLSEPRGLQIEADKQHEKRHKINSGPTKLFVFGDSYADTGNSRKTQSSAWKSPYGTSFPGKPAGRFSDGRVLTDYIARYLGVKSPVPYRVRKAMPQNMRYGVNLAFGGAGVFDTDRGGASPNISTQIDYLADLVVTHKVYSTSNLTNSVALVSVAGNDYAHYVATNGSLEDLPSFIASVVNQLTTNLIRIHGLGVKKIAVNTLEPLGCLPVVTELFSFRHCNAAFNSFATAHNTLLKEHVQRLNRKNRHRQPTFVLLDLYESFTSVLNHPSTYNIIGKALRPCCVGVSGEYSCGSVDKNNVKKYSVCKNPKSAFFWDSVHPSQAGWHALYNKLRTTTALQQLRITAQQ